MAKSELSTFDGKDNRKEIMKMLFQLPDDSKRAKFLQSLIPHSLNGFANKPLEVTGNCSPIAAYYMMVGMCNELGVNINYAASRLEKEVKKYER